MSDVVQPEKLDPDKAKRNAYYLPLPDEYLEFIRSLRRRQTDAESVMWYFLRARRLGGFKFRRQFPLEPYVIDFYCHEKMLAIELDGGQHNEPSNRSKDEVRNTYLEKRGIRILRFWNHEVLADRETVLQVIWEALHAQRGCLREASRSPVPSPKERGEKLSNARMCLLESSRSLTPGPSPRGRGEN